MKITDQQLDAFILIYQKNFGVLLDRESAYEKGIKLVVATELILKDRHAFRDKNLTKPNMTKI